MRRLRPLLVALLLAAAPLPAMAQDVDRDKHQPSSIPPPDPTFVPGVPAPLGPDVNLSPGDHAPNFRLDDSLGGAITQRDLLGHWSALVFDESRKAFAPMGAIVDSTAAMGVRLYGVCRDGAGAIRAYADENRLRFPLLSDPTGEISQLFDMFDDDQHVIQAGLVMVDAGGTVRMVVQGPALHPDDVLTMVRHTVRGT